MIVKRDKSIPSGEKKHFLAVMGAVASFSAAVASPIYNPWHYLLVAGIAGVGCYWQLKRKTIAPIENGSVQARRR
jgi:4-hydroxybenzoate polyprenyltransferase